MKNVSTAGVAADLDVRAGAVHRASIVDAVPLAAESAAEPVWVVAVLARVDLPIPAAGIVGIGCGGWSGRMEEEEVDRVYARIAEHSEAFSWLNSRLRV